ncbi:hypothetical protein Pelo_8446 [Pelomyxa schiedti]|nr:hypothetical protein Pelo_8446 [Pelomyxa schiedti]
MSHSTLMGDIVAFEPRVRLSDEWREIFTRAGLVAEDFSYEPVRGRVITSLQQLLARRITENPHMEAELRGYCSQLENVRQKSFGYGLPDPSAFGPKNQMIEKLSFHTSHEDPDRQVPTPTITHCGLPLSTKSSLLRIEANRVTYTGAYNKPPGCVQVQIAKNTDFRFEVKIDNLGAMGTIGVGIAPWKYDHDKQPGWLPKSIGYHGDDGNIFQDGNVVNRGPTWEAGDVLACYYEHTTHTLTILRNSSQVWRGTAQPHPQMCPTVGFHSPCESVRLFVL